MMKSRSGVEICLPAIVLGTACLLSLPTLVLALLWIIAGAVCLGHRDLKSFPSDRVPPRWQTGVRSGFLWFYHLAWWPWYMRVELGNLARTATSRLCKATRHAKSPKEAEDKSQSGQENDR